MISLLVGFRKTLGSFRTQVLVGPTIFGDTKNYPDFALGGSVIAELLWLGEGGEFAAFEARYLSVDNRWSLNHISGFPLESLSFKLGPELGVFGSDEGWGARAGVAFTGLTVLKKMWPSAWVDKLTTKIVLGIRQFLHFWEVLITSFYPWHQTASGKQ